MMHAPRRRTPLSDRPMSISLLVSFFPIHSFVSLLFIHRSIPSRSLSLVSCSCLRILYPLSVSPVATTSTIGSDPSLASESHTIISFKSVLCRPCLTTHHYQAAREVERGCSGILPDRTLHSVHNAHNTSCISSLIVIVVSATWWSVQCSRFILRSALRAHDTDRDSE